MKRTTIIASVCAASALALGGAVWVYGPGAVDGGVDLADGFYGVHQTLDIETSSIPESGALVNSLVDSNPAEIIYAP